MMNRQSHLLSTEHEFDALEFVGSSEYAALKRRDIRALIFYVLYIFELTESTIDQIGEDFSERFNVEIPRHSEVMVSTKAIIAGRDMLDSVYKKHLENWDLERLSLCTKIILRFGVWELLCTKTDPRIIINEAVELAKSFDEDGSHRFINGILDAVAKK